MPINPVMERIYGTLKEKEELREELLSLTREINRLCAKSTRRVHRGDTVEAEKLINRALSLNLKLRKYKSRLPEMFHSISYTCQQELTEATGLLRIVQNRPIPSPEEIQVEPEPYLTGMADLIGELRRYVLELIKIKDLKEAGRILEIMERLFDELVIFDLPDKMIPGLRKKVDGARAIIDRTKSHYVLAVHMEELLKGWRDVS